MIEKLTVFSVTNYYGTMYKILKKLSFSQDLICALYIKKLEFQRIFDVLRN